MALSKSDQALLVHEFKSGKKAAFRQKITKVLRENPDKYKILELGKSNSHQTHLTVSQFNAALPSLKKDLVECIFADIDEIDDNQGDGKLKITTIVRWVNNRKRKKEIVVIKDENFVYDKLKNIKFTDLDDDEGGTIDRDELRAYFDKEGVNSEITDVVFDIIDANGDGDITIREWFKWQTKFKKSDLKLMFKTYAKEQAEKKEQEEAERKAAEEEAARKKAEEEAAAKKAAEEEAARKKAEEEERKRKEEEERKRKEEEAAAAAAAAEAERKRKEEEEAARKAEEERKRKEEEERKRKEEEAAAAAAAAEAERKRKEEEERKRQAAEEYRKRKEAEEAARKKAEEEAAAKKAAEEEAARKAAEEEAARKKAEEEARRKAEEEAAAKKKAEEEAARKKAEEEEAKKKAEAVVAVSSAEMTDNPHGKTNSWSRSKSVDMEFDYYPEADALDAPPDQLWILSKTQRWRECEVSEILDDGQYKIHYKGFNAKYDEVVPKNSDRLTTQKPEKVVAKGEGKKSKKKKAKQPKDDEKRIWCESSNNPNIHRECVICEEKDNEVKLHFISYHQKYDIWLPKDSSRIATKRPRGDVLIKGDNLSCYSKEFKAWLEVEVVEVNNHDERIKVGWVGSNNLSELWLPINSPLLSIQHKKHDSPPPSQ